MILTKSDATSYRKRFSLTVNICVKDVVYILRVMDSMVAQWIHAQKIKLLQWTDSVRIVEMAMSLHKMVNLAINQWEVL